LIDFGEFGMKKSSAQITKLYKKKKLTGKQVICVTNFAPKQIANFVSEFWSWVVLEKKEVVLLQPDKTVKNGCRIALVNNFLVSFFQAGSTIQRKIKSSYRCF